MKSEMFVAICASQIRVPKSRSRYRMKKKILRVLSSFPFLNFIPIRQRARIAPLLYRGTSWWLPCLVATKTIRINAFIHTIIVHLPFIGILSELHGRLNQWWRFPFHQCCVGWSPFLISPSSLFFVSVTWVGYLCLGLTSVWADGRIAFTFHNWPRCSRTCMKGF